MPVIAALVAVLLSTGADAPAPRVSFGAGPLLGSLYGLRIVGGSACARVAVAELDAEGSGARFAVEVGAALDVGDTPERLRLTRIAGSALVRATALGRVRASAGMGLELGQLWLATATGGSQVALVLGPRVVLGVELGRLGRATPFVEAHGAASLGGASLYAATLLAGARL